MCACVGVAVDVVTLVYVTVGLGQVLYTYRLMSGGLGARRTELGRARGPARGPVPGERQCVTLSLL